MVFFWKNTQKNYFYYSFSEYSHPPGHPMNPTSATSSTPSAPSAPTPSPPIVTAPKAAAVHVDNVKHKERQRKKANSNKERERKKFFKLYSKIKSIPKKKKRTQINEHKTKPYLGKFKSIG